MSPASAVLCTDQANTWARRYLRTFAFDPKNNKAMKAAGHASRASICSPASPAVRPGRRQKPARVF